MKAVKGNAPRVHCNDKECTHESFKSYKSHKHLGKSLLITDFEPCPGVECWRCKQWSLEYCKFNLERWRDARP